ncbi:MAG: GNAT family N-acetyltransferase [Thaumarchaeota archaeon]|nr:GNAT family N-acetyltransferase [Nitrososphaerota archaeon]
MLTTKRLVIREFRASDWRSVHAYASDPEVVRYMHWGPNTEPDTQAFVRRAIADQSSKPRTRYEFAITVKASGELIGGCGIEATRPERKEGVIFYSLNKAHWGKGYGTESARALVDFGFARLALHRIFALCDPSNIGSNHVLNKAGMTLEGRQREDFLMRGKWRDTMVYAILEREWSSTGQLLGGLSPSN